MRGSFAKLTIEFFLHLHRMQVAKMRKCLNLRDEVCLEVPYQATAFYHVKNHMDLFLQQNTGEIRNER